MVSNASPRPTNPKINKLFVNTEETSSNHACALDRYLKRPYPTIIDGEMTSDSGWFLGSFEFWGL